MDGHIFALDQIARTVEPGTIGKSARKSRLIAPDKRSEGVASRVQRRLDAGG